MIRFSASSRYAADVWEQALDALTDAGLPRDGGLIALIDGDGWDSDGAWPYLVVLTPEGDALLRAGTSEPGGDSKYPAGAEVPARDPREGHL